LHKYLRIKLVKGRKSGQRKDISPQEHQAVTVCHADAEADRLEEGDVLEQAKVDPVVYVSGRGGVVEGSTQQQQQQPVHADQLEEGAVQEQAKVDPVQVVYVSAAGDLEGPSWQQQRQPVHADLLIAVSQ